MAATLREQLSSYPIPRLTTVLRVDFSLQETSSAFTQAMRLIEAWWNERAKPYDQRIDAETSDLSFARDGFKIEFARTDTQFALAMQEPDSSVPDRTWIWDFALRLNEGRPEFAVRGSFRQPQNSTQHPDPRAPRFLKDLVDKVGALDRDPLESRPRLVGLRNLQGFIDLAESNRRTLPIVAVSEDGRTGEVATDPENLARFLAGAAHVVRLDRQSSWELSERWGQEWSTFQGAVRCYNALFNRNGDDKYKHKLWLADAIRRLDANATNGFVNLAVRHVFTSVTAQFEPLPLLSPSDIRRSSQIEPAPPLETPPLSPSPDEKAIPEHGASEAAVPSVVSTETQRAVLVERSDDYRGQWSALKAANEDLADRVRRSEEEYQTLAHALQQERAERAEVDKLLAETRAGRAEVERSLEETKLYGGLQDEELEKLKQEKNLALGDSDSEPSQALKPLWRDWSSFFHSLQNTAAQFRRMEGDSKLKEGLEEELAEAKKEIYNLKATIESMERGQSGVAGQISSSSDADWQETLRSLLPSLAEKNPPLTTSLRLVELVFPERIQILPTAVESAKESSDFLYGAQAFGLLWRLATEYWESIQEGNGDAEARKVFGVNSYAAKEASLSKPGRARRTFEYQGKPVLMEKHLKIGAADNLAETLRIHFEWASEEEIIVVGHCGGHLDF